MCTGIRLKAKDGSVVYGRTLEFGCNIESKVIFIPKGYKFIGATPFQGTAGLKWDSKYSVLGTNAFNHNIIVDGLNDSGLSGGIFYFSEFAKYQDVTKDDADKTIASWQLLTWILTNFKDIDEVKQNIDLIKVADVSFAIWKKSSPPIHFVLHDKQGFSLVIEYVDGRLNLHDNPNGVVTNSPTFDWHITNLSNYANLSCYNSYGDSFFNLEPSSQGNGLLGLPGDFTSPSRFVRATFFTKYALNIKTNRDALHSVFHILNLFDIPYGSVRDKNEDRGYDVELTYWTSASDLKSNSYHWHTFEDRVIKSVALADYVDNKDIVMIDM